VSVCLAGWLGRQSRRVLCVSSGVPNLHILESVDSPRLAKAVNDACVATGREPVGVPAVVLSITRLLGAFFYGSRVSRLPACACVQLNVFVQVNTSGEPQKSGTAPEGAVDLSRFVMTECPALRLRGLMTIGKYDETAAVFFEASVTPHHAVPAVPRAP
jgi:uncharacterized pyridoxal phosphate-containing UPF0001 family protein